MAPNLREGMRPALEEPLGGMGPEGRDGTGVGAGREAHGLARERGKLTELPDTPDSPRGNPRRCSQAPRQEPRPARGKACGDREKVITEKLPEPSVGGQAMCSAQATLSWTWPTSIPEGACSGKSTTQAQKEFSYWFIQLFTPETLTESLLRSQITDRRGQWPRPPRPQSLEREAAHPVPTTTGGGWRGSSSGGHFVTGHAAVGARCTVARTQATPSFQSRTMWVRVPAGCVS